MEVRNDMFTKLFIVIESVPHHRLKVLKCLLLQLRSFEEQRKSLRSIVLQSDPVLQECLLIATESLNIFSRISRLTTISSHISRKLGCDPCWRSDEAEHFRNDRLETWYDLDCRRAGSYYSYGFVFEIVVSVPSGGM